VFNCGNKNKNQKFKKRELRRNCCANYGLSRFEIEESNYNSLEKRKLELIHKLIGKGLIGVENLEQRNLEIEMRQA
jgi:hypothetical protein